MNALNMLFCIAVDNVVSSISFFIWNVEHTSLRFSGCFGSKMLVIFVVCLLFLRWMRVSPSQLDFPGKVLALNHRMELRIINRARLYSLRETPYLVSRLWQFIDLAHSQSMFIMRMWANCKCQQRSAHMWYLISFQYLFQLSAWFNCLHVVLYWCNSIQLLWFFYRLALFKLPKVNKQKWKWKLV